MQNCVRIKNYSFAYPNQSEYTLKNVNLTVRNGDFLILCGSSGCGKTTLLRQLKPNIKPHGAQSGEIVFENQPVSALCERDAAAQIGFVSQSAENQIVTDKVWHELAFGMESLGLDSAVIRRRVAEIASFFGIQSWFYRPVSELSGGQKQILCLASVMVTQPKLLLLDEPTSQLDPIAASDFLHMLQKINLELGTTIILAEHRLEEAFSVCTQVAVMENGGILCTGTPSQVGKLLHEKNHGMFLSMPSAMRIWSAVDGESECPVSVAQASRWLAQFAERNTPRKVQRPAAKCFGEELLLAEDVWFRYEKNAPDVVKGLNLSLHRGELFAILGGNGTGKSTSLKLLANVLSAWRGKIKKNGTIGLLPQAPMFFKKTVREDLLEILKEKKLPKEIQKQRMENVIALCDLSKLTDRHPYDLSGGEQQRAALAKILLLDPDIILLDEPTKGFDARFKQQFASILKNLIARGTAVLMVSHDVEFCASYVSRCALFFDGSVICEAPTAEFFLGNRFYTTAVCRMAGKILPEAVTAEVVISAFGKTLPEQPKTVCTAFPMPKEKIEAVQTEKKKMPLNRTTVAAALILLMIPLTIFFGIHFWDGRKYYFISFLILLESMLPFFLVFEGRKPQARELVLLAVLCAIGVAGRAACFMLPQFKPVVAITVLSGIALGAESGFLVGSVTMLASNIFFSQGPWTPWQMFSMGIIGFLAGVFFRKRWRNKWTMAVFGALCAIVIYGGIMNPASALMWSDEINLGIILSYYVSGFPMDCVQAAATFLILLLGGEPILEKLERIKTKYGLIC